MDTYSSLYATWPLLIHYDPPTPGWGKLESRLDLIIALATSPSCPSMVIKILIDA